MKYRTDATWDQPQNLYAETRQKPVRQEKSGNRDCSPADFRSGCQQSLHDRILMVLT